MAYFEIDVELWLGALEDESYTTEHRQLLRVSRYGLGQSDYEIARPALLKTALLGEDDGAPCRRVTICQFISTPETRPPVLGLYDVGALLRHDEVQPQADDWRSMAQGQFYERVRRLGTLVIAAPEDGSRPERVWTMVGDRAELACN